MEFLKKLSLLCITFTIYFQYIKCFDQVNESGFTISVGPGTSECFFQSVKSGEILEIEYQVIDSSYGPGGNFARGELNINFQLFSPTGGVIISESQKEDAIHRHDVTETGDYKICLDNKHSRFNSKMVYLEVYIDPKDDNDDSNWENIDTMPELTYNDSMEIIKTRVSKLRDHLQQIEHYQAQKRANEARDRNLQEHNFNTVNTFSIVSIVVMLIVGFIQVVMVRSLFEERSRLHKILKTFS